MEYLISYGTLQITQNGLDESVLRLDIIYEILGCQGQWFIVAGTVLSTGQRLYPDPLSTEGRVLQGSTMCAVKCPTGGLRMNSMCRS